MTRHLETMEEGPGISVIHFNDAYPDAFDPQKLDREMVALVDRLTGPALVVDLAGVKLLTSDHLGMLIRLRQVLAGQERFLHLAQAEECVAGLFRATRLDRLFPIHHTVAAALTACQPTNQPKDCQDQIARRAYEIWVQRGRPAGSALEDWYAAVREFKDTNPK